MKSKIDIAADNYKEQSWDKRHIMNDDLRIAFVKGAQFSCSLVDDFLRLHPEYRCLDVIGKFKDYLNKEK